MKYKIAELEDQILATIAADTTGFAGIQTFDTYAGQVNAQMFLNPEYMQGFMQLLPFVLVSYQGRTSSKAERDSSGKTRFHQPRFRIYTGTQSERSKKEAVRDAYDYLAALYDAINNKVPLTNPQQLPGFTPLSGTALTGTATILKPFIAVEGQDETIVVNIPGIVVYSSDFVLDLLA